MQIRSGKLQGTLFSLDANVNHTHEAKFADQQTEDIWHRRYGQLNHNSLRSLQNNNLVKEILSRQIMKLKRLVMHV